MVEFGWGDHSTRHRGAGKVKTAGVWAQRKLFQEDGVAGEP